MIVKLYVVDPVAIEFDEDGRIYVVGIESQRWHGLRFNSENVTPGNKMALEVAPEINTLLVGFAVDDPVRQNST